MPMQKGMSFSIKWKLQEGEPMNGKKDRERFSIKFNENDPAHDAVIRLLEKQGPHSKAQFLVNAVLHYVNCTETPDITIPQKVDRAVIEEIVTEFLEMKGFQKGVSYGENVRGIQEMETETVKLEKKADGEQPRKEMDKVTLALIADTMSAFRGG